MNKVHKVLIDELKDIVGHDGQLIELDFRFWPSCVAVAYKVNALEYGWDTMWTYTNESVQNLDFPIMDFIKKTFEPLGNVMFCSTSYSLPNGEEDYVFEERPHGNSTLTVTAKDGKFYMSVKPSILKKIKKAFESDPENSIFDLVCN